MKWPFVTRHRHEREIASMDRAFAELQRRYDDLHAVAQFVQQHLNDERRPMTLNGLTLSPRSHAEHWYERCKDYRELAARVEARERGDPDWRTAHKRLSNRFV